MTDFEIASMKALMSDFEGDWAVCGGWAIDLYLGGITREHKDIDLFIWRDEQLLAQAYFMKRDWQLQLAYKGELVDWQKDDYLELPKHTIWCKHETHQLDFVELLLNEHDKSHFLFRRDTSIKLPITKTVLQSDSGIPYLAPEIALLYKSNNVEHGANQHDFEVCFPKLEKTQQQWLIDNLRKLYGNEHEWL